MSLQSSESCTVQGNERFMAGRRVRCPNLATNALLAAFASTFTMAVDYDAFPTSRNPVSLGTSTATWTDSQPTHQVNPKLVDRYASMSSEDWFRTAYEDMSLGDAIHIEG